jgi:calcineurin-like phosphoesterase family protein
MTRTVIVGDVHGCSAELEELLDQIQFRAGQDRLFFVGDLIVRGPDPHGTLSLFHKLGASAVRGNHEDRLLAWRRRGRPLGKEHQRLAEVLSDEEWGTLEAMPLWVELPEHGLLVVHAGVVPGVPIERTEPEALLKIRTVDSGGRWSDEPEAGVLWGVRYRGPPHVVFGHNARAGPQLHEWATGIDTGCVYGGQLTAVLLAESQAMPKGSAAKTTLRSVTARRAYYAAKAGSLPP